MPSGPPPSPRSERLCDAAVAAGALWTVSCHAAVAAGASLRQLLLGFATAAVALLLLAARRSRRGAVPAEPSAGPAQGLPLPPDDRLRRGARVAGVLLVAASVALAAWRRDVVLLWASLALLLLLAAALFWLAAPRPRAPAPVRSPRHSAGLLALALLGALLALVVHRPDVDDSFYVNVAVTAADHPERPLLAGDSLHGIPGLPLHQKVYRLHSWELAHGALSWLLGIPAIAIFHLGSAALAGFFLPLAWAALLRLLAPRDWLPLLAALIVVLVASGETHRAYGNFAFVRLWQGKSVYLFVLLPLVYAAALRFALLPTRGRFARLMAVQVAAVGCSSSAVWAGPAASLLALCAALSPRPRDLRVLATGALASLYVLGVGWWLMQGPIEAHDPLLQRAQLRAAAQPWAPGMQVAESLRTVLGGGRLQLASLFAVGAAWACCPPGLGRRFAIAVPLGVWLLLANPFLERLVERLLTGPSHWRVLWSLPVPLLLALVLGAPLQVRRRALGLAAFAALVLGFALAVPRMATTSAENRPREARGGVRIGWPDLKVPRSEYRSDYEWAGALSRLAGPGAAVLAPEYISAWVPTFHHPAVPLLVREAYLRKFLDRLGRERVRPRRVMTRYVEGTAIQSDAGEVFRRGLDELSVRAVVLAVSNRSPEARELLREAGFERRLPGAEHELWLRPRPAEAPRAGESPDSIQ